MPSQYWTCIYVNDVFFSNSLAKPVFKFLKCRTCIRSIPSRPC